MIRATTLAAVLGGRQQAEVCARLLEGARGRAGADRAGADRAAKIVCREIGEDGFRVQIRAAGATQASRVSAALGWIGAPEPFVGEIRSGPLAVAIDGAIGGAARLREAALERGGMLRDGGDAEVIAAAIAASEQKTTINRLLDVSRQLDGGFSLIVMDEDRLIALRDPQGRRPLWVGRVGESLVLAPGGEAIREAGGVAVREVEPGELVILERSSVQGIRPFLRQPARPCLIELLRLCRPGDAFAGVEAHPARLALGAKLAALAPIPGAVVMPADLGAAPLAAALAQRAGLLAEPLIGDRAAAPAAVAGRPVLLAAPALDTARARAVAARLREQGARAVHLRLAAPPLAAACLYGVDLDAEPAFLELRGREDPSVLKNFLGVDSVEWLDLPQALENLPGAWCTACMPGSAAEASPAPAPEPPRPELPPAPPEPPPAPKPEPAPEPKPEFAPEPPPKPEPPPEPAPEPVPAAPVLAVPLPEKAPKPTNQLSLFGKG